MALHLSRHEATDSQELYNRILPNWKLFVWELSLHSPEG